MTVSLRSNQALQASTLVGCHVYVPSNHMIFTNNETVSVLLTLERDCTEVVVFVESQSGDMVLRKPLGAFQCGDVAIDFDPLDADEVNLGHGQYLLRAEAQYDQQRFIVPTYIKAIVESVKLLGKDQEPMLNLQNHQSVALSQVRIVL